MPHTYTTVAGAGAAASCIDIGRVWGVTRRPSRLEGVGYAAKGYVYTPASDYTQTFVY